MNQTKRILTLLLALSLIFSAALLTSCGENLPQDEPTTDEPTVDEPTVDEPTTDEPTVDEPTAEPSVTLVVEGKTKSVFTVSLKGLTIERGLVSILDALKAENKLDYGITDTFLDYVGEVKNDYDKGEYVYIYTSVTKDQDVSQYADTVSYDGKTLVSSGVGAIEMTVEDGAVFYVKAYTPSW